MSKAMYFYRNRRWLIRILLIVYGVYAVFTLPFSLIQLEKRGAGRDEEVWFAGGIFVFSAVTVSFGGILLHMINYSEPHLQRYIIGILLMVPIYAINGWFALRYQCAAIYLDTLRECYEACVIYFFVVFLLNYLKSKYQNFEETLRNKGRTKHIFPLCCLPTMELNSSFIKKCKYRTLQYSAVRILTTITAFICELNGVYHEAAFDLNWAWIYLAAINCLSHIVAMHSLMQFYVAIKNELEGISPFFKFCCIYYVVFLSFWQSVAIICLGKLNWIPHGGQWGFNFTVEEMVTGIQDFLICVEMFGAAILHLYAFSHDKFIRPVHEHDPWFAVFMRTWKYFRSGDIIEQASTSRNDNEQTPLLDEIDSRSTSRYLIGSQSSADRDAASLENSEHTSPQITPNNFVVLEDEEGDRLTNRTQQITVGNVHT